MPVLDRCFLEVGRSWRTGEVLLPTYMGTLPTYRSGSLSCELPEIIEMVKLLWKSKNELQTVIQKELQSNEEVLASLPGNDPVLCLYAK